jgi:AmmeMemoRadiSam system protein A
MPLDPTQRRNLLALARASIETGLTNRGFVPCAPERLPPGLMQRGASFVTLRIGPELRGCCGTIEATRPLAADVWHSAWAAAFSDPRFPPLSPQEWRGVSLQISVLSDPVPLLVVGEWDLLQRLRPQVDGLILEHGGSRATFLPAVWEQIADPATFVRQLKLKAGWAADFWSPRMSVQRYTAESFGEE